MSTKVVLFVELYKFYENYLHIEPLYLLALCAEILLISFGSLHSPYVLRNKLPPRQNKLATKNSHCSLRLPLFFLSPLAHEARGDPD